MENMNFDACIYGATSAGIAAAVKFSRLSRTVVVLEPGSHIGGLTSGGLGETDIGNKAAIGGIAREFYARILADYQENYGRGSAQVRACRNGFRFEPSAAKRVFRAMLDEANVSIHTDERLLSVEKEGKSIRSITTTSQRMSARVFIDATYEGDLMAGAGVSYAVGREPNSLYGETLNGIHFGHPNHNFVLPLDPYRREGDSRSGLLPGISGEGAGAQGDGDRCVQAYCFRMCLTDDPANRIPFPKPAHYDSERYALLARYIHAGIWDVLALASPLPNRKTDTNNHGAFSMDNIGMNYQWPEGDAATRAEIFADHVTYQQGLIWFLCHNSQVPVRIREEVCRWGLPADEYVDHHSWSPQLYVREARRMISDCVMTEHHCVGRLRAEDSVGLAAYTMDSHNCRRIVVQGRALNEGNVETSGFPPYPISYRSITPRASECDNLLVPICLSASHIAYGSIRMEPVFLCLGEAAATAAALAVERRCAVQNVSLAALQESLVNTGGVLAYSPPDSSSAAL